MTQTSKVPPGEREVVRVFALDMTAPEAETLAETLAERSEGGGSNGRPSGLAALLGTDRLDPDHVEIFPASDLTGVGLPGYLSDGLGIAETDIDPDRTALEAERAYIVIVHSPAFGGKAARLSPTPPLRHLGTYRLAQSDPPGTMAPATEPAGAPQMPRKRQGPPPRLPRALALLVLLGAAALALVLAYLLGGDRGG